ncbi:MAG: OsmC family protein [Candidatus Thermoplasmatota archaeon]|nr:OsmC family protein [Candidatus Thermoplasmatota archaeon]
MKAIIKQIKGISFVGKTDSNHWVTIDGPKEFDGSEAAARPKELLLLALGTCTGSDVVTILNKKKMKFTDFELHLDAEEAKDHPKVFTKIHIEFLFRGKDLNSNHIERAIELSQNKYCPITYMLKSSVEINTSYKLEF